MSKLFALAVIAASTVMPTVALAANPTFGDPLHVQLGPRPFYLVDQMPPSDLKRGFERCIAERETYEPSAFSIGHRGAPLQFPEHTKESYEAAARMGAGVLECDVTFTKDLALVCRHSQCDLHTTTNILATPLAEKCAQGFEPAEYDPVTGALSKPASARCCTSDITVAEFKTLEGKMDAADRGATSVEEYLGGTAEFRTDLYATGGTLLTHAESIFLFQKLGVQMTPELKAPAVPMPFNGFTQADYARKLINEYLFSGVAPERVWPQSFNLDDVLYWVNNTSAYGEQAVFLDGRSPELASNPPPQAEFDALKAAGVNVLAPPMPLLLQVKPRGIAPSPYAWRAQQAGLQLISWSTERSGRVSEDIVPAGGAFYYNTTVDALKNDGDILRTIDVLARQVGIIGLFSDWPATTTLYANCLDYLPEGLPEELPEALPE